MRVSTVNQKDHINAAAPSVPPQIPKRHERKGRKATKQKCIRSIAKLGGT